MNPISAIEKLINEHGSAKILKERLKLAADEFSILERKLQISEERESANEVKITALESKITELESELSNQQDIIDSYESKPLKLEEAQNQILSCLHNEMELSVEQIASKIGLRESDAKYHCDQLEKEGMVFFKTSERTHQDRSRSGPSRSPANSLGLISITTKGREYAVKKLISRHSFKSEKDPDQAT